MMTLYPRSKNKGCLKRIDMEEGEKEKYKMANTVIYDLHGFAYLRDAV